VASLAVVLLRVADNWSFMLRIDSYSRLNNRCSGVTF